MRDESGSGATDGMLTIHQQRHLGPLLNAAAQMSGNGNGGNELRGGAPATMSSVRASTGGTILIAPHNHHIDDDGAVSNTTTTKKKGVIVVASGASQPGTITRARDLLKSLEKATASNNNTAPQPIKHTQPLVTLQPSSDLSTTAPTRPIRTLGGGGVADEGAGHAATTSKRVLFQDKTPTTTTTTTTPLYSAHPILASTTPTTTSSVLKHHQPSTVTSTPHQHQMTYPASTTTRQQQGGGGPLTSKPRKGTGVVINIGAMRRS
eukprot:TRINITY_DN8564_c0_g1_i2.p1 TRINITY_DN8564_c0_g1~~TRINITY_DN8564_c0_g1_i2.p1  ORF type:complete len:264 (-),score=65.61 TRINITY_DN8564_c0_g1_i2:246-1037(-)